MGDLEVDTRLEIIDAEAGRFRANLSSDWKIWGPNGGYVAAIALRAVGLVAAIPRPAAFSGHFLRVARFDTVDVTVTPIRLGRRSESLRVAISQGDRPVFEALVRTAARAPGLEHDVVEPPDVPAPDSLESGDTLRDPNGPTYQFWQNLESRPLDPERFLRRHEGPSPPAWREWYRFRPRPTFDDPFLDAARSLLLLDTLTWPAACQPHPNSKFQAPNLDITAWFHRSAPESEWLLTDHTCPVAEEGLMGTVGRVFSRDGKLLASGGAQLLCVPLPPESV